jgi:hypothetical protein
VTKLTDNTFALSKDSKTILMNTHGEAIQNVPVKWKETPEAIGKIKDEMRVAKNHYLIYSL